MILVKMRLTLKLRVKMMVWYGFSLFTMSSSLFCFLCLIMVSAAYSLKDARIHADEDHALRTQGNQSICPTQTSGSASSFFCFLGYWSYC
jgi:hypothetical protein